MKAWKRGVAVLLLVASLGVFGACGASQPCEGCGDTPTKGYRNTSTGEDEYYCKKCASDCAFCSNKATKHYTSLLGIVFVCKDCYKDIQDLNE